MGAPELALSLAGGAKLVHSVRMIMEQKRKYFAVKLDIKNAHNEVARSSIKVALDREPTHRHLAWHVATCLAPTTSLESGGKIFGKLVKDIARVTQKQVTVFVLLGTKKLVLLTTH